jgi:hypothetical protein
MDTARFDLPVGMASPAHEGGFRLVVQFAPEFSPRVIVGGEIGMTLRTG